MFSIEKNIEQQLGIAGSVKNIKYGPTQHAALTGATTTVIREPNAQGYLILSVTYSLTLVTGLIRTITINGHLYLSYAAVAAFCGNNGETHFERGQQLNITTNDAELVGTVNYQVVTVE